MLAALRSSRPAQIALAAVLVAGGAFGWWTLSPLFLTTTLNEELPRATASTAPAPSAAPTAAATLVPAGPKLIAIGQLQRVETAPRHGPVCLGDAMARLSCASRTLRYDGRTARLSSHAARVAHTTEVADLYLARSGDQWLLHSS